MKHLQSQLKPLSGKYPETYFAGANTASGFRSDYATYIQEETLTRLFVLKGGSGTGKSTLINRCAAEAVATGANITLLLCSSDPSSSDGVIITGTNGARIGIVDGTAPHMLDPSIPGAVGSIVNLGDFWKPSVLTALREDIAEHIKRKQIAYARAYRYLAAYGEIQAAVHSLLAPCIQMDKMQGAVKRFVSAIPKEKNGSVHRRQTLAVSMEGLYRLETFQNMADSVFRVQDVYGSAGYFLDAVRAETEHTCRTAFASPPLGLNTGCGELFFPTAKTALITEETESGHVIHMQRFIDKKALSTCRGRLRFAIRCENAMMEGATEALEEARSHHFALEALYKTAMDFTAVSEVGTSLARQVLSLL